MLTERLQKMRDFTQQRKYKQFRTDFNENGTKLLRKLNWDFTQLFFPAKKSVSSVPKTGFPFIVIPRPCANMSAKTNIFSPNLFTTSAPTTPFFSTKGWKKSVGRPKPACPEPEKRKKYF